MKSILEYVMDRLQAEMGNWPAIARASEVPYRTVQKIGSGKTKNPRIESVEKLATYFRQRSHRKAA